MAILQVRVKPNAKHTRIQQAEDGTWLVSLTAPPTNGKANQALIKLLAKTLNVPKSRIRIKSGQTARLKRVEVVEGDWPE